MSLFHLVKEEVCEKIAFGVWSGSATQKRHKLEMLQTDEGQKIYGNRIKVFF